MKLNSTNLNSVAIIILSIGLMLQTISGIDKSNEIKELRDRIRMVESKCS